MGFPRRSAEIAVEQTRSDSAEEVLDWLFSHMDDPILTQESALQTTTTPNESKAEKTYQDGPGKYKLRGFITHMGMFEYLKFLTVGLGSSPHSGHYVCHLLRNGIWYLYNDEKVAVSQNPPKALGLNCDQHRQMLEIFNRITSMSPGVFKMFGTQRAKP